MSPRTTVALCPPVPTALTVRPAHVGKSALLRTLLIASGLVLVLTIVGTQHATAQDAPQRFDVGDYVEAMYAGDRVRAVIVGGYEDTDHGYGTYQVHFEGDEHTDHRLDMRISSEHVHPRFRTDASQTFGAGDRVEMRRWDGAVYAGEVVGVDGDRYEVRYTRDGSPTTEWVREIDVRPAQRAAPPLAAAPAALAPNAGGTPGAPAARWPGQRFEIGDRVMYDELGFLVTQGVGTVVSVDAEKRLYTVRDADDASWGYTYTCYNVVDPAALPGPDFFVGHWDVRVRGATYTFVHDGDLYRRFSGGLRLPPLEIKADGTYTWVVSEDRFIRGQWVPREGRPGITLRNGLDGLDYTLYEATEGFATTAQTRDEIGFVHLPTSTGHYHAYRIGPNRSCVLTDRTFAQ